MFIDNRISGKIRLFTVLFVFIAVSILSYGAQSVSLAWDPNTEPDLGGYRLYYGITNELATNVTSISATSTNTTVQGLFQGQTYFFYLTATNTSGLESDPSNMVFYQVPSNPSGDLPPPVTPPADTPAASPVLPVVSWFLPPITYGAPLGDRELNALANFSGTNVPGYFTYAPSYGKILSAGNHAIKAVFYPYDETVYTNAEITATLEVQKAPLAIKAENIEKTYGPAMPSLRVSYEGFVNGDSPRSLPGLLLVNTSATSSSPPGAYPIFVSGVSSSNYNIAFFSGTLTINPANLIIMAKNARKTYGPSMPSLGAYYFGFVNGDTASSLSTPLSLKTTATSKSPVGVYPIIASGASSPKYNIIFIDGELTMNPANLTIRAGSFIKVYGDPVPELTATYTGFVNGDTKDSLTPLVLQTEVTSKSPVGYYSITASGAFSANYNVSLMNGTLNVIKAPLRITADNKSRYFGEENPLLTVTYSGFVNGDTPSCLDPEVVLTAYAKTNSLSGNYPIGVGYTYSPNYFITRVNGILTVKESVGLATTVQNALGIKSIEIFDRYLHLKIQGKSGSPFFIQSSGDLLNWADCHYGKIEPSGFYYFSNELAFNAQFYKIIPRKEELK